MLKLFSTTLLVVTVTACGSTEPEPGGGTGGTGGAPPTEETCGSAHSPCMPVVIATNDGASGIATDGTSVFFAAFGGPIVKVSVDGGGVQPVVTTSARAMALDGTHVYFTTPTSIERVAKEGGATETVATVDSPGEAISLDSTSIYFQSLGTQGGQVLTVAKAGGDPVVLNAGADFGMGGVAVNGTDVFFASYGPSAAVFSSSKRSVSPKQLATGQGFPKAMAADDTHVYWTNYGGSGAALTRVAVSGGTPQIIADGAPSLGLAVDSKNVYWLEAGSGRVRRAAKAGGKAETIATGQTRPRQLAVDSANVYWTDFEKGTVTKISKAAPAL